MTRNNIFNKLKSKLVLILALVFLVACSAFVFTACKDDDSANSDTTPTYTKQETDDAELKNGSFEFGLSSIELSGYPVSSPNDWGSAQTENSSTSSILKSGVVNTSDDAWEELLKTIYADSDYLSYAEDKLGFDKAEITTAKTSENADKTEDEVNEIVRDYIIENYLSKAFTNPKTHEGAVGDNVYMLNNYTKDAWHTSQTVKSSSTITLEKGTYGEISFYVNAKNLDGNGEYFANVRLNGSFASASQEPYKLYGIKNTDGWKKYSIYVKADDFESTSVSVSLALGYSPAKGRVDNNCYGTVYFDDITYTVVSVEEYNERFTTPISSKTFSYNSDNEVVEKIADNAYNYNYNLVINADANYNSFVNNVNLNSLDSVIGGFTKSNVLGGDNNPLTTNHPEKFGTASKGSHSVSADGKTFTFSGLEYASYTAEISDNGFYVSPEKYAYITFEIDNNLDRLGSTDVSVYVVDQDGEEHFVKSYSDIDETQKVNIIIKNNYPAHLAGATDRTFKLLIVVGPTDINANNVMNDYASGSVTVSNIKYAYGDAYQYVKDLNGNIVISNGQKIETPDYAYYSLAASVSTEIAIDTYTAKTNDIYTLESASSAAGMAHYTIANVKGYTGITSDHAYFNAENANNVINERSGNQGDGDGNYAGLINSKAIDTYTVAIKDQIKSNLNYSGEKSIQPIMIYNNTADSYGFVGNAFTINQSAYAKISVRVRVTGDAKAYVYLVDTSDSSKPVATLGFEKGNVEGDATYDKAFSKKLAFEGIDKDLMGNDGWITLTFYVATGASSMNLRLEVWNGSRDGEEKSQGFVFFAFDAFNSQDTFKHSSLSSGFTEPALMADAYTTTGNPLYDVAFKDGVGRAFIDDAVKYVRELDATEIQYNAEEDHDNTVSYKANYVWASNLSKANGTIYAVYNTIDPVAVDPYASEETEEETDEESGCAAESDPSAFWLSFSSIVLGAALALAIIMLIVKNVRRRRANIDKNAKSHYKVSSRYKAHEDVKKKEAKIKKVSDDEYEDQVEKTTEEVVDQPEVEETDSNAKEPAEEYVYGDVQDFGETEEQKENE